MGLLREVRAQTLTADADLYSAQVRGKRCSSPSGGRALTNCEEKISDPRNAENERDEPEAPQTEGIGTSLFTASGKEPSMIVATKFFVTRMRALRKKVNPTFWIKRPSELAKNTNLSVEELFDLAYRCPA